MHNRARWMSSVLGLTGLVALSAVVLMAAPTQALTIVFLDDFQDDTVGNNPVIGSGDVGLSWDNEKSPG